MFPPSCCMLTVFPLHCGKLMKVAYFQLFSKPKQNECDFDNTFKSRHHLENSGS